MKTESLESLLLDRALGELAPEVEELLDAHLERDPAAACRAQALADTVQCGRRALAPRAEELPHPIAARHARLEWSAAWSLLKLAACLAIGLGLGWWLPRGNEQPAPEASVAHMAHNAGPGTGNPEGFRWIGKRISAGGERQLTREGRSQSRYRLIWESPAKLPRLEEHS